MGEVAQALVVLRLVMMQVDDIDIFRIGPMFESNPVFPARTNTGGLTT